MRAWANKTEITVGRFLPWVGIGTSKFHDWKARFGKVNEHNAWVPRDHWLTDAEREGIRGFARQHPLEGYRRLTFMMLDANVVACSPASVYRVLRAAGLLAGHTPTPTKKGTGFMQPLLPHEHWHVDVSYLNIAGTFYFLCSVLDGCSRFIVHWEIREKMEENDVETIIQRAREAYPDARPRIISDNGPQFIAKDFKEFIRICGMTHVKTSPYYPQSNGKIERWHGTLKGDCIRVLVPLSLEDARRIVADYVIHYNTVRLHSAIGYITPQDKLAGRETEIFAARDRKLAEARQRRQQQREAGRGPAPGEPASHPAIDFAALRPWSRCQPSSNFSASTLAAATVRNNAAHARCTARRPARVAASPSTWNSTPSTASNAADPAMHSISGPTPPAKASMTPPSICANAYTYRCRSCQRPSPRQQLGTERRNP